MVKLGHNPVPSAIENLQGIEYQPCRFFYAQKNAPKMHRPCLIGHIELIGLNDQKESLKNLGNRGSAS